MIIIINGAINAGKSAIARLLSKKIPNTANIEVDHLRAFVDYMPLTQELIEINLMNAAKVANTFYKANINSVITYPLLENDLKLLLKNLDATRKEIKFFTLDTKLSALTKNRGNRKLAGWEKKRTRELHELIYKGSKYGNILINNTNQTPGESVKEIISRISEELIN